LISVGDGARLFSQDVGFVTALSYKSSFENVAIERNEYEASGEPRFAYKGNEYTYSVLWGGLLNFSYKLSEFHKLSFKNTYSRTADDEITELSGAQFTDAGSQQYQTAFRFVSRSVYSGQLFGDHFFPSICGMQVQWRAFTSLSTRNEPDYRRVMYARELGSSDPFTAVLGFQANLKNGGRFYSDLTDKTKGIGLDVSLPLLEAKLKAGGLFEKKDRDFSSRLIGIIVNGRGNGFTESSLYALPLESIFAPENFRRNGFSIDEYQSGTNNYSAGQTLAASYVMLDVSLPMFGNDFRLVGGARLEHSTQTVNSLDVSGTKEINVELDNADVLPSVNLIYKLNGASNVRFAFSQTVNRPELRELAPFAYYDFNTQTSIRGNESLQRALIQNYDVRFEAFPEFGEMLSASFFYKKLTNAIEQVVVSGSALGSERTFANADQAKNYGFELETRFSLKHLGGYFSNFTLTANYSWIKSSVDVLSTETTVARRDRPLQGQSPYMFNLGLLFVEPSLGTSVNLLYNTFGERIIEVATAYEEDVIEEPRDVIDITVAQTLFQQYELKVSVKDLLHQEQVFRQGDKKARSNSKSTALSIGISFKL
jgi:TonB-dependent receptor